MGGFKSDRPDQFTGAQNLRPTLYIEQKKTAHQTIKANRF